MSPCTQPPSRAALADGLVIRPALVLSPGWQELDRDYVRSGIVYTLNDDDHKIGTATWYYWITLGNDGTPLRRSPARTWRVGWNLAVTPPMSLPNGSHSVETWAFTATLVSNWTGRVHLIDQYAAELGQVGTIAGDAEFVWTEDTEFWPWVFSCTGHYNDNYTAAPWFGSWWGLKLAIDFDALLTNPDALTRYATFSNLVPRIWWRETNA